MTTGTCREFKHISAKELSVDSMSAQAFSVTLVERLRMLKMIVEIMLEAEADVDSADNPKYLSVNEGLKFIAVLHVAIAEGYAVKAAAKIL